MTGPGARTPEQELLRRLLPEVYWVLDAQDGGALAALVDVLADEYARLRDGVATLYDDVFLQTCEEAIVPYIGEGLGVTGLAPASGPGVSNRALVGSIVALRRRKGTLAAAARGAAAATGWAVYAEEGSAAVGWTQPVAHVDRAAGALVDLGDPAQAAAIAAPWSRAARTVGVHGRPLCAGRPVPPEPADPAGAPAPQTVAVSIWRLRAFPVRGRTPRALSEPASAAGRAFTFDPLGLERPLFRVPEPVADAHAPPSPAELPRPVTTAELAALLRDPRGRLPFAIHRDAGDGWLETLHRNQLAAHDLRHWRVPRHTRAEALVDPERGRLLFTREPPAAVAVDYAYGFAGDLGGGPYVAANEPAAYVPALRLARGETLGAALAAGHDVVIVPDSATHGAPPGGWDVPPLGEGASLRIAAAPGAAPVLDGDLTFRLERGARVELHGLTITGTVHVEGSGTLTIEHSTLAPRGPSSLGARAARGGLAVSLGFCVVGRIHAGRGVQLSVADSVVDGRGTHAIAHDHPVDGLVAQRTTVLGDVAARAVQADDCIFAGSLRAPAGLVRNSFLAPGSEPPQHLGCERHAHPRFTSVRYGDPGYAQLHARCPPAIASGASLGGEMGAFNWLGQPARVARLPVVLHDLLPVGVAASVTYIT